MVHKKPIQKFISFTDNSPEFEAVKEDMESGWNRINKKVLMNQNHFLFLPEKN